MNTPNAIVDADGDVRYVPEVGAGGLSDLAHVSRYEWARAWAPGKRVLDFGCGSGFGAAMLADVAGEVVAVDYSPTSIDFARERYARPNLAFAVGDVTDRSLPGRLGRFDLVVSFDVIEHVERYWDFAANTAELAGEALIGCPNRRQTFAWNAEWNRHHVQEFTPAQLRWVLEQYFGKVEIRGQDFTDPEAREAIRPVTSPSLARRIARVVLPAPARARLRGATSPAIGTERISFDAEPEAAFGLVAVATSRSLGR